jgi:uncharacterized protein YtpQ (UPF0354 family)
VEATLALAMWPSSSVRQRAGALSATAERFVAERWLERGDPYEGGRTGLLALCKELARFSYALDVDEESERRFVEGAGALLGVLLIEHITDAAHVSARGQHRVRLGAHGFFDPFAAIDRALDAQDVRRALAVEIEGAEAEARSEGPISRVVALFALLLRAQRPDLSLADQFDCTLTLRMRDGGETLELDVRRAVETTREQKDGAVEMVARRLVSMLPGAPNAQGEALEDVRTRLLPRLARSDALRQLTAQGQSVLFARPLLAELSVALLIEHEGRARYVRNDELTDWRLSPEEASALALDNLRARSERARIVRDASFGTRADPRTSRSEGSVLVARSGDGRDSARVLLPELFAELSARIGPHIAVALPHRDTFFACAAEDDALLRSMAERAANDCARAPHALSAELFGFSSTGLFLLARGDAGFDCALGP